MRGDGRVFLRGTIWWIAYYGPGTDGMREYRESSGSESQKDAATLLRQRLREVGNHRDGIRRFQGPAADRITVANLLDALFAEYERDQIKSLRHTTGHSKPIRAFFGFRRALSVNPDLVRTYIKQRTKDDGVTTATINRELAVLKRAFNLAVEEGKLASKPYIPSAGSENNVRTGFFEVAELERMLQHLDHVMGEMARFGFRTGWRAAEVRLLTWSRVDRAAREIRLDTTKNGRPRLLPLDDDLAALVERLWSARQYTKKDGTTGLSEFLFHEGGQPLSQSVFNKRWSKARNAAGLPGRIFHDFRRSAARNLVRSGVSETVAMTITGHLTRSVFDRYNITSTDDTLAALQRQQEFLGAAPKSNVSAFRNATTGEAGEKR
jgi:integrase